MSFSIDNLPPKITYDATKYIEFTYDAAGRKWKKTAVDRSITTSKHYFGPIGYKGSAQSIPVLWKLKTFRTPPQFSNRYLTPNCDLLCFSVSVYSPAC